MVMSQDHPGADCLKSCEKASRPGCTQPYYSRERRVEAFSEPTLPDYVPIYSLLTLYWTALGGATEVANATCVAR